MDEARQHLEHDIQRAEATRKMLAHLKNVVMDGPRGARHRDPHFPEEAVDALEHGADLAKREWENLTHVAVMYDAKVNTPVPDPAGYPLG